VVALIVALIIVERATGLSEQLTRETLRAHVAAAGVWGIPLFIGACCVALFLHVPATGIAFVAVGVALYGRLAGGALAYAGAVVAVTFSFVIVRAVGGKPFAGLENRVARRVLARLESHPVLTVIVLRLLFYAGAPVNYALALSGISARAYLVGSVIGLAPPAAVLALFFDVLIG
jgi:uncharacterized membrane protein YdjX (TVP38/TMEM64 family)